MSKVRQIIREAITELIDDSRCIDCGYITNEDLRKWFGKGGAGGTTKGGWDRYGSDGQKLGKCGGGKRGGAYACLSAEKARKLGPKGRAAFVRRKRRDQKKAGDDKKGKQRSKGKKPVMSKTGEHKVEMYNRIRLLDILSEAEEKGCPLPTQDIDLNLKNRNKAFKKYNYGPADPRHDLKTDVDKLDYSNLKESDFKSKEELQRLTKH